MRLLTDPKPDGALAKFSRVPNGFYFYIHHGWCVSLGRACLLNMVLFDLELHYGFTVSYLHPKAPTKAL